MCYAIISYCVSLQGYSRRILVRARPIATSGSLPLTVDSITGVSVGGLCIRSHTHKGLDSYQEDGLTLLRSRWNEALEKRKQYLDDKMQLLAAKQGEIFYFYCLVGVFWVLHHLILSFCIRLRGCNICSKTDRINVV